MDIRTGRTYGTFDEARADGVPESDIAEVAMKDGRPVPRFKFSKGSFKPVGVRPSADAVDPVAANR